jgi:hypothetical protein
MQAINNGLIQSQVINTPYRTTADDNKVSLSSAKYLKRANSFNLPEDFVTLSMNRSATLEVSANKKSSVPVTTTEKKALRDSFSVYA